MHLSPGTILTSSPCLEDPNFQQAVIVLTEYDEKGAIGFIINRLFNRKLNELVEFNYAKPFSLYAGGPVDTESLFILHKKKDIITGSKLLFSNIYTDGNFKQVVDHINNGSLTNNDIKIFIGYCGWDKNELEEEIREGSWRITDAEEEFIFNTPINVWETLLNK